MNLSSALRIAMRQDTTKRLLSRELLSNSGPLSLISMIFIVVINLFSTATGLFEFFSGAVSYILQLLNFLFESNEEMFMNLFEQLVVVAVIHTDSDQNRA